MPESWKYGPLTMSTDIATSPYETCMVSSTPPPPPRILTNSSENGAYSTIWSKLFKTTSTAQYSPFPFASAFHTMTIAMQRASPTMMTPVRYVGRSGSAAHASPSMRNGATSQLSTSERRTCVSMLKVGRIVGSAS